MLLRDILNLTGTHIGCDTSQCGACVVHVDGKDIVVEPTSQLNLEEIYYQKEPVKLEKIEIKGERELYFGELFGTRSGDKGGCANLGVWAKYSKSVAFLIKYLSVLTLLIFEITESKKQRKIFIQ